MVAMATERLNLHKKKKKIISRGIKLKLCRNVYNISLYKKDIFYCRCLCAFVSMATYNFHWLIMGKVKIIPPNRRGGGGHIAFGADPFGIRIASCLHSISWTNGWILTKHAQTHYWEEEQKWLDFGDLDPIFWTKWWILAKLYVLYHWDN